MQLKPPRCWGRCSVSPTRRLCVRQGSPPPPLWEPLRFSQPRQSDSDGCPSWGLHNLSAFSAHCNDCLIACSLHSMALCEGRVQNLLSFVYLSVTNSKQRGLTHRDTKKKDQKKKTKKKHPNAEWINGAKSITESLTHTHKRSELREWEQS